MTSYPVTKLQVIFNTDIAFQSVNADSLVAETHKDSWRKNLKNTLEYSYPAKKP